MPRVARTWNIFGHDLGDKTDGPRYVGVACDLRTAYILNDGRSVFELTATENPEGEYIGWVNRDEPDILTMVDHERLFGRQFPGGYRTEESHGYGRAIRVVITRGHTH